MRSSVFVEVLPSEELLRKEVDVVDDDAVLGVIRNGFTLNEVAQL